MPQMKTTVTTTTTTEVTIKPAIKRRLLTELRAYAELKAQADAIEAAMEAHKATIGTLRESTGERVLELEGFKLTQVQPDPRGTLDKKRLLGTGLTVAQLEDATVYKPVKPYEKVTCPGEKAREREDD